MIHKKINHWILHVSVLVRLLFLLMIMSRNPHLQAQKLIYSDLFAEPLLLNPALAGINNCSSVKLNYTKTFTYDLYSASAVAHLTKINASLAGFVSNLKEGDGILNTQKAEFIYAYRLPSNGKHKIQLALGGGAYKQSVNLEKIVYSGMINPFTGQVSVAGNLGDFNQSPRFSLQTAVAYYSNTYRAGLTLSAENTNLVSDIPQITAYIGRIFKTKQKDLLLMPIAAWSYGTVNRHIYSGIRVSKKNIELMLMLSFQQNINSLHPSFGFKYRFETLTLSYSYTNIYHFAATTGLHQSGFGLAYNFFCASKRKNNNTIYCSDF